MDAQLLFILALVAIFVSVALLVYGFVPEEVEEDDIYGYRLTKRQRLIDESPLYAAVLPLVKIFAHYIRKIPETDNFIERVRKKLRDQLPRSGYVGAFTPNEFLGMCCTVGLLMFFVGLIMSLLITDTPQLPIAFIFCFGGMYLPFLNLQGAMQARLFEIDRRLPYVIDLLVLSMRAGLDFMSALDRVVTRGLEQSPDDPMIQELGVVLQEMRVGTPKAEALLNLCERVDSDYLKSMVGAIIQSEKRGTPLANVLEIQIDTIRNKRTQKVEKQAGQAAVKILAPLMFIFAAVIVVVIGAMVIRMQGSGL